MDVNAEAKRIMTLSLGKLYSSRSQRGGLRLHRSLLLSLVMRTARDIYHTARLVSESKWQPAIVKSIPELPATEEQMDTSSSQVETSALQCAPLASPLDNQPPEVESTPGCPSCDSGTEDKENCRPACADRHLRKRRGKAAAEPDFLPSKKARMDTCGEIPTIRGTGLRSSNGNSCRTGRKLTYFVKRRPRYLAVGMVIDLYTPDKDHASSPVELRLRG
ncbi:hypothetical protein JZ751_028790, partial [Albula glossodonta]